MGWKEFCGWRAEYSRDPWGTATDDKRHAQICIYLHQIMSNGLVKAPKLNIDELYVSKFWAEHKKMKILLYGSEKAPWLEDNVDEEQLALEGQALLSYHKQKYGKKS